MSNVISKCELARLLRAVATKALETDERSDMEHPFENGVCSAVAVEWVAEGGSAAYAYVAMSYAQRVLGMPGSFGRYGDWRTRPFLCLWMANELDNRVIDGVTS